MVTCAASGTRYSKEGGVLAKVASDSAHAVNPYKDARKILRDGLDAAVDNPCSNARMFLREGEEKTFAKIDIVASSLLYLSAAGIIFALPAALFFMELCK